MTTAHGSEHNDVWAHFEPGDFQLIRNGVLREEGEKKGVDGWYKVYHNAGGRSIKANTVDFTAHQMSTGEVLQEGMEYRISLAGRSSKVIVHRIILFPCEGLECYNPAWKKSLKTCSNVA